MYIEKTIKTIRITKRVFIRIRLLIKLNKNDRDILFDISADEKKALDIFTKDTSVKINYMLQLGYYLVTGFFRQRD